MIISYNATINSILSHNLKNINASKKAIIYIHINQCRKLFVLQLLNFCITVYKTLEQSKVVIEINSYLYISLAIREVEGSHQTI